MPPGVNRFNPSGLGNTFQHLHNPHLQHHPSQQHGPTPPSLGGHPSYATANTSSSINPFALGGGNALGAGFAGGAGAGGLGGGAGGGGTGLASHAAQMGFAHGAALQQQAQVAAQQAQHDTVGMVDGGKGAMKGRIRDVWAHNLDQEMAVLRGLVEKYPYISMDTEFPGIVARPMGDFRTKAEYHYQTLRCNVDLLRMIQLGITLFSPEGEVPPAHPEGVNGNAYGNNFVPTPCTWQFNFRFSLMTDMYAQDSIELLQKAGINFDMHDKNGIDPKDFGSSLVSSGLVLLDEVKWISFHSGYDFGYLMKQMLCRPLPDDEEEFRKLLNIFFPAIYDIKFLMKHASRNQAVNNSPLSQSAVQVFTNLGQKSSLQDIAEELGIKRVGQQHQAGSDSLVTGRVFWEVRRVVFNGSIDDEKYLGQIWGLNGVGVPASAGGQGHQTPNLNGATIYTNGTPSTPNTAHVGLASTTPGPHGQQGGGSLTPGGGGGVFGGFQFTKG